MNRNESTTDPPKRRRRGRKRIVALLLLTAFLVWLNGPGWRWIGGVALRHALADSGMSAEFELKGTLIGGIRVEKLFLSGGPLKRLEVGSAGPLYRLTRALRGEIDGVAVERVHAIVDLAAPPLPKAPDASPSGAPDPLPVTLKKIRGLIRPLDLRAADFRLELLRGPETLLTLQSSDLVHEPGSDEFRLRLGALAAGPGYEFPAQESVIRWSESELRLDRFDLTPRLGIRDLKVEMPAPEELAASGVVQVEESRLVIDGTLSSATLRLEGEPLPVHEAVKNLSMSLPLEATLDSLEAEIRGFDRSPDHWSIKVGAGVRGVKYEDWQADELRLDLAKDGSTASIGWELEALGGNVMGEAGLRWSDLASGNWQDFQADLRASVPRLDPVFAALKQKLSFAPADAPGLPASSLSVEATARSTTSGIAEAGVRWLLSAEEGAPSLAGENQWKPGGTLGGTFGSEGIRATYELDLEKKRYEASASFDSFRPDRLAPWAAAGGVALPAGMSASGTWQGGGDFGPKPHRGSFDLRSFEWIRKDTPPLLVRTRGDYDWPAKVTLAELTATADGQTIEAEATLAEGVLKLPRIEWKEGTTRLVGGRAEIPVPENPADLKAFLKQEIPLSLFLESEWIDSSRLAAWLPEGKSPLSEGSGRVNLVIAGTPANPKIDLDAALKGLRLPDQPDVPVIDADLSLDGAAGSLVLDGEVRPAAYPPVKLSGKMPFKPGEWANDPGSILKETVDARVDIPRLEVATFRNFMPAAEELAGTLEGGFTASGPLEKPELAGELRLSDGAFSKRDSPAPPVSNAGFVIRLQGQEVRLERLSFESSGGTFDASGTVGIADPAAPTFDLRFRATSLPLKRDESMIVRADADLGLSGNLQQARISGTVDLVDSLFYRDFEILPVRVPFTAPARPRLPAIDPEEKAADLPAPFGNWALDVRVRTRDPLLIRGNLARGSATADIRFGGTLGKIEPQGSAIIRDVTARLPFSTLKVNNGIVSFTPAGGLNPELNIRGTSNIGRYDVNVFFYGPVNAPRTALTSDPPLAESEIMTLLATGTTSDGLEDGQAATMKAAQLFVEEWRRGRLPFAEQLSKALVLLNNVDVRVGEDDPLTGKRLNSATIEVTERIVISGSVDKESNTRVLGAFVLRFK